MAANGSFCSNGEKRGIKVEDRGTSPHWLSRNGGVETMAMPQRRFAYAKATEDRHDRGNQAT